MKAERLKKRTEKFNESLLIYFGGYATHKNYDLEDWFKAKEFVFTNKHLIPKFG